MTENVNEGIADLHLNEESQIMVIDAPERSFTETMRVTKERLDQMQKEMQTTLVQAANIEDRIDNADPTYDLTADHECLEGLEKRMKILQVKIERCQKRLDMLVSTIKEDSEPSSIDTNSARMAMHTSKPSKVTLDDTIPRFGSVHLGKGQKFKVLCNTMEFLEMFSSQAKNIHGENFENICARLMKQAILDDDQRQRMEHRMGAMQPHELTWLKCESLFTETLMTALERDMELKVAITRGILPGESYQRYAWRLERLIRIYKVCESTSHPITLRQLKMTIPPEIFDIMTMRFIMEHALLDVNAEDVPKDITRADQFCTYLEKMTGPEDSDERKRSKVRVAEDGNTEGRQLKRQKHNTLEEDDYQGSTTLKPMYDCQNGCGKNSTHDTDGCIICGICLKRGHYAVRCPNKNRPTNNVSIGHSGQNPNRGVSGRNGYNNRGRGAYRGGSQWRGGHGTGVNTPGTIPQGEFTTADFTFTTERRGHTKEHLSNAATLVHTTEQNNHARKSLWGNTQPEGSKESARITINESNIKVSQNNNIKDDRSSQKDDSHLAMSITHAVIAVGRIPTKPGHYQNYAGRTYAAIAVHYAAFKTDHKSHSSWRGNGDVNMENDELIQDDENERAHQQLKPDYNLLVNPHSGMHAHVMHENENLHKQYSAIRKKDHNADTRIRVNVLIFGDTHEALIDTGASHSFIDTSIVRKYDIKVNHDSGHIELADKSIIPRIGETEHIEITCGMNIVSAPIEVIDQKYAFAIGMDLFHRFGFSISGLPDPNMSPERLPEPIPDEKPTLKPLVTPLVEKTDEFIKEKTAFMKTIRPLMVINGKIPPTSFCPVPEMKVFLPVPKGTVVHRRSRTFAYHQRPILDEAVEAWLRDDVITLAPVANPHNNTLTLAAKKDLEGKKTLWRVCLDPRPLNAHLPDDNFPVPLINDIMQQIAGNAVFTTIDLRQAYHRLPIHVEDQPLTAFMHNGKQYMFKKAPFGLKPLSSLFQRGMSRILGDLSYVLNFIDDIIVFSRNREDHAAHVKEVIERLNAANLIINQDKCHFFSTQVALLGFIVDLNGKRVDPKKLANIDEWQPPTTGKQVQSYMGTFNFFREYIPLISTISAPLDALRNATGSFELNDLQLKSFNALKNLLVQAPVLSFPDFTQPFYVATDASNVGIGAVLYQLPEGEANPKKINYISFVARSLQERERKYSATQKELLAIVYALLKFHYYLWQNHFTLYTDHRALTFIHSQKDLNSMLTGWQEIINSYTFKVVYRPGILNVLPDALSRQFPLELWTERLKYDGPIKIYGYIHMIQNSDHPKNDVPDAERQQILAEAHEMGHVGTNAMVNHIHSLNKTWAHLAKDCLDYVKRCPECQRINIERKGYHPMKAIHAHLPGEHMAVDLVGKLPSTQNGNVRLLVLVDVCTRFVFLIPLKDKTARSIAKALFHIFTIIGFPRILQSDNGKEFVNEALKEMTKLMGTQHRLSTPYHPRGNGVAENHVKSAMELIRKKIKGKKHTWDEHVPMTQLALNTRVVALHNSSPFSLFFARRFNGLHNLSNEEGVPLSQSELEKRLTYMTEVVFPAIDAKARSTQKKMIERFNKTILHNVFPDGAKVMAVDPIQGDKLTPRYEGPFTVVRRNTGGAYVLQDGTGETLGRNYAPSQLKLVLDDLDDADIYELENITAHRTAEAGGGVEYLVKWKGFPSEANTWEHEGNFIERKCIDDYWRAHKPSVDAAPQPQSRQSSTRITRQQQRHEQLETHDIEARTLKRKREQPSKNDESNKRRSGRLSKKK